MDFWQPRALEPNQLYRGLIGPLILWCRKVDDEIHVGHERGPEDELPPVQTLAPQTDANYDKADWTRWVVGKETNTLSLAPCLPDRAVVVRTESPVMIPSRSEARFFVSIPIWVKIAAGERKKIELSEIPCVIRSNTWFGDREAGELCYSLVSRARRSADDADHPMFKAVCPVRIRNRCDEMLPVERMCVHVEYLSLFCGARLLWTNDVTISFEGDDKISKIDYGKRAPDLEPNLALITEARTPAKDALIKRSLDGLARLAEFGGTS